MKILCTNPEHNDTNPSMEAYPDGSTYCFVCGFHTREGVKTGYPEQGIKKDREDLDAKINYIRSLPIIDHRGLRFHFDSIGYYILWPGDSYYKCRRWSTLDSSGRYISSRGNTKPIFYIASNIPQSNRLIVVEGEINALSLATLELPCDIVCPGGVNDFANSTIKNNLHLFTKYSSLLVLVDNDIPGFTGAMNLRALLKDIIPDITIRPMDIDCNELLVERGKEALKKEIEGMGL